MATPARNRPPFADRLKTGLEELGEWARGDRALRTTELVDGEVIRRVETGAEFRTRRDEPKTPIMRLLDLTAGWVDLVQHEKGAADVAVTVDELCELYQAAGRLIEIEDPLEEDRAVRAFVQERVLPLLLRR